MGNLSGIARRTRTTERSGDFNEYSIRIIAPGLESDDVTRILESKGFIVYSVIQV